MLHNLKFSNLNFNSKFKLKLELQKTENLPCPPGSSRNLGDLTPRLKGMKATKQRIGFQVKPRKEMRVLKILVLSSYFPLRQLGRKSEPCEE